MRKKDIADQDYLDYLVDSILNLFAVKILENDEKSLEHQFF